ncbi:hypothetical protein BDV27DRAFT_138422 [Aspergillus caelatus]|uniref:Uncharacterized protein n=1 Tax=Aspergillus caelatus TaxID=61420 RepID=A0A5N6ZK24_9EURO|nr:uncharacterized protein BDV27DRAFT_138422 [Aspergillus caelatus]KAE8357982.1 hypothetical protein BDV27DRAFT_138422 [Aspergillus caelatus]
MVTTRLQPFPSFLHLCGEEWNYLDHARFRQTQVTTNQQGRNTRSREVPLETIYRSMLQLRNQVTSYVLIDPKGESPPDSPRP